MKVVGLTDKAEEILKITKLYQYFRSFKTSGPRCKVSRTAAKANQPWKSYALAKLAP